MFKSIPVWLNAVLFLAAAIAVWFGGTRLTGRLDDLAKATGISHAIVGLLLLATATSLPEIAAVVTSSAVGNPDLAVNNLLGSVAFNVMLIAMADAVLGRDALTSIIPSATTLFQGVLNIMILALVCLAIVVGDVSIGRFGAWPAVLALFCLTAFWFAASYPRRQAWRPTGETASDDADGDAGEPSVKGLRALSLRIAMYSAIILVAGFVLAQSADAIASSTGVGSGFIGLVLVAGATSLPEVSSITEAVRRKRYEMALGDVFGTNIITVALIFLADIFYANGSVLATAGRFEATAALIGLLLTCVFVLGLLERRDRTIFRMGYDSAAAIAIFVCGMVLLFLIRR